MPSAGDDDDDFLFRPVWETEDEEAPPAAPPRRQSAALPDYAHPLLAPLARAQHAVTRLDARAEAAAPVIAEGLRSRLALREAAGWLAWARFSIHPRDLALRDAGLTGAYGAAALADRLAAELPATTAQGTIFELAPSDLAVHQALSMARYWRRLAEMRSWRPIADAAAMRELLASIGAGQAAGDAEIAEWLADSSFRQGEPALIRAGLGARAWMNRAAVKEPLTLDGIFLGACLWRASGFGRAISLPFWLAPETHLNRLSPRVGIAWMAGFLECVASAATAALTDLDRLQAVADKGQMLTAPTARSKLPAAWEAVLRAPVVTAAGLAKSLRITPQGALGLLRQLQKAGLIHEATGRASWQGFTIT
jgi:DNA binding protein with HTH domain